MKSFKRFLFVCVLAVSLISFITETFKQNFQQVFLQSIKGLESLKGTATTSGHVCTVAFAEFNSVVIATDESLGVLALTLTANAGTDEAAAKKSLADWETQIAALLPAGDYVRSQTYDADVVGYMKTIYDFNSGKMADKQKRPSIEMGVYMSGTEHQVRIKLFEPFFKNQYTPKMP
ncbi:MAG: hypothetical protein ACKVOR_02145 [Flavobacteriales bacterium]